MPSMPCLVLVAVGSKTCDIVPSMKSDNPGPFHMLLIEDSENDAILFRQALESCNLEARLTWVEDGSGAVAYLEGRAPYADRAQYPMPDLIVADLKMPKIGGFEFLDWLRQHPKYTGIPAIILSSTSLERDIVRAYDLGAKAFHVKPSTFTELAQLIRAAHGFWTLVSVPWPISEPGIVRSSSSEQLDNTHPRR
jgi:CheY-like chemotaxis protein